jgi:uncharacterized membrane protein
MLLRLLLLRHLSPPVFRLRLVFLIGMVILFLFLASEVAFFMLRGLSHAGPDTLHHLPSR